MREDEAGKHFEHETEAGSIERFIRGIVLGCYMVPYRDIGRVNKKMEATASLGLGGGVFLIHRDHLREI